MTGPADAIIRLEGVRKTFGRTAVLQDVNLAVRDHQITVIIGPSGCGKSVLLKHMVRLLRPDAGKIWFRQTEISRLPERDLVPIRCKMGLLFQGGALFDSMTVQENICFPLEEHATGSAEQRHQRCHEVLALVGLSGFEDRYPGELSGGQQKRVALARAIAMQPDVILYDEPTTGLDPIRADLINELILRLRDALNNAAVVVTHDMASARKVGDRILMFHQGQFILDTTPSGLDQVKNDVVLRFIEGRASEGELAELAAIGSPPKGRL